VALLVPSEPLSLALVAVGFAGALGFVTFVLIASEIAAATRRLFGHDAGSLVFDDNGIREVRGRWVKERGWDWVVEARELEDALLLSCVEPMRSFRLGGGGRRTIVVDRAAPGMERLRHLLEVHRPGIVQRESSVVHR
jgi:hypothetical protein